MPNANIDQLTEDFLLEEVPKISGKNCYVCSQPSATVRCNHEGCTRTYHFICGREQCLFDFNDYESYCHEHIIPRKIYEKPFRCWICFEWLDVSEIGTVKLVPTCCIPGYSHLECLRKWALSAGKSFRCACLEGGDDYARFMRSCGIYVPEREAFWKPEVTSDEDSDKN